MNDKDKYFVVFEMRSHITDDYFNGKATLTIHGNKEKFNCPCDLKYRKHVSLDKKAFSHSGSLQKCDVAKLIEFLQNEIKD